MNLRQSHRSDESSFLDAAPPLSGIHVHRQLDGTLEAATQRAHAFLEGAMTAHGIPPVIWLYPGVQEGVEPGDPGAAIRGYTAVDIGLDARDEAFSSMIALKLCGRGGGVPAVASRSASLVRRQEWRGRYRFFRGPSAFVADTDATALAVAGLYETGRLSSPALVASAEELLRAAALATVPASQNLDEPTGASNGDLCARVVMVHWEEEPGVAPWGRFHDAAVAANVLYALKLAKEMGLEDPRGVIPATLGFVREHLRSGAWLAGTRRYPSPDTFLYHVSCLCQRFTECRAELGLDVREAHAARAGAAVDLGVVDDTFSPLNVAQQVIAACHLGMGSEVSELVEGLAMCQDLDGSWPAAPFCALGHPGHAVQFLGSKAITTMFAARALLEFQRVAR